MAKVRHPHFNQGWRGAILQGRGYAFHVCRRLYATISSRLAILAIAILLGSFTLFVPLAQAQINCATLPHWSSTRPQVNQTHVFCGEWNSRRERPSGFHSSPGGLDPETVANFTVANPPNAKGIYDGRWTYVGHPTPTKFSTMFPDSCSQTQVLNSIFYAVTHPTSCPSGAPRWTGCGPNQPTSDTGNYCQADNGAVFAIAFAPIRNGRVYTAFPLR